MFCFLTFTLLLGHITKSKYAISYGNHKAKHFIVNYFDLGCAHCIEFYKKILPKIRKKYCDKGKLLFIYEPYPVHHETLIYMTCCTDLNSAQKQALFETLMELDQTITPKIIEECMSVLKVPYKNPTSTVLEQAMRLTEEKQYENLPVIFFDGKELSDEQQDHLLEFLEKEIPNVSEG